MTSGTDPGLIDAAVAVPAVAEASVPAPAEAAAHAPPIMQGSPPPAHMQVTAHNFQDPPFNRWGFLNVRSLVPTALVWRGDGPVTELSRAPRELGATTFEDVTGRTIDVDAMLDETYTDGFLVLHRGAIVTERYRDGFAPHQPHLAMSVTKSVIGTIAGTLVARGQLSPRHLVVTLVPELRGSAYESATVRHLLDMRVGVRFNEDYEDPTGDLARLDGSFGWRPRVDPTMPDNVYDYLRSTLPSGLHGGAFHYASANTDALGWVLERASGTRVADLLSETLWQPMGAEHDAYIALDRLGASQTDGGLCLSLRDLGRFGQVMLNGGTARGKSVIPRNWISNTRDKGDPHAWDIGSFGAAMPGYHYRNCWYVHRTGPRGFLLAMGIHGQLLYIDPAADLVVAKFSSQPKAVDTFMLDLALRAFLALTESLGDRD